MKILKALVVIFFILVVPLAITYWIFPLRFHEIDMGEEDFSGGEEAVLISSEKIRQEAESFFSSSLADFLGISNTQVLYDMRIINKSTVNCQIVDEAGVRLIFKEGNPEKYFKTSLKKIDYPGSSEAVGGEIYEIPFGGEAHFTFLPSDRFVILRSFFALCSYSNWEVAKEKNLMGNEFNIKLESYIKHNFWDWVVKFVLILFSCVLIYASFITVFKFFWKWVNKENQLKK